MKLLDHHAPEGTPCDRCGATEGVELEDSRTSYSSPDRTQWDFLKQDDPQGGGPDPNAPIPLCRACAKEHHEYWDGQWAEYYHDRL